MPTVNMLQAKSSLSRLVADIESGVESEVILARNGRPVARIVPLAAPVLGKRIGVAAGQFVVPPGLDLQDPELLELFEGPL
ncbi:MAG: prevent-host-death protein [Myxococcales bacterium]|nr:prevent-host-death protein [Myxococcales bacterium]